MTTSETSREHTARRRYPEAIKLIEEGQAPAQTRKAMELFLRGMTGSQIADELGISRARAYVLLSDPLLIRDRQRKRRYYGTCIDCGGRTYNGGATETPMRCIDCEKRRVHERGAKRVIEAIQDWVRRYGIVPGAMDWNVQMAQREAHPERLAEILSRHQDRRWPGVGSVQQIFGSWNAGIRAAGFEPLKPGHRRDPERHRKHLPRGGPLASATEILQREIEKNDERQKRLAEQIKQLKVEREDLTRAIAALNGKAA